MAVFDEPETSEMWVLTPSRGISYDHVLAEAGERPLDELVLRSVTQLRADHGADYFSDLLFALTHKRYAAGEAQRIWQRIVEHRDQMSQKLGRNPGVAVAALDYLSNVEGGFKRPTLIDELKLARLVDSATRDDLTGLFDRATLRVTLERAFRSPDAQPVSVIMIDLDDFKLFNDSHGHLAGDRVLARTAQIMQRELRDTDVPARYGGEEFCVVLPSRSLAEAATVAERLRARIEQEFAGRGITASFGVASRRDGDGPMALLRAADDALYVSKRAGKNRVTISNESQRSATTSAPT